MNGFPIQRLLTIAPADAAGLADLLIDCVDGGASVSFMHPIPGYALLPQGGLCDTTYFYRMLTT